MIKTQLIQYRGLYIEWCYFTTDSSITNLIGFAIGKSFFYSTTSHPHGKRFSVMISSFEWQFFSLAVFLHGRTAKLTTPNY